MGDDEFNRGSEFGRDERGFFFSGWGEGICARSLLVISCNNRGMKSRNKLRGMSGRSARCPAAGQFLGVSRTWVEVASNFAGGWVNSWKREFRWSESGWIRKWISEGIKFREIREVGGRWSG